MKTQSVIMLMGGLLVSSLGFSQKTVVTSAAVEYKNKFQLALMQGKVDEAKTSLLNAKKYIDEASEHPETKGQSKTLYYKGMIYGASTQLAMMTQDTSFVFQNFGKNAMEISIASLRDCYKMDKKFRADIDQQVDQQISMLAPMAEDAYKKGKFMEAGGAFYYMYQIVGAKNIVDSVNLYNAALCFEKADMKKEAAETYAELAEVGYNRGEAFAYAARAYNKLGEKDKAIEILNKGKEKYKGDKTILFELTNMYLANGQNVEAEKTLSDAIAADPKNKQLYYTIGTIYTELKQNEKAEEALLKAIELDPNYTEALYNLGAHYVTWATDLRNHANTLNENDFNYDITLAKSTEMYQKAIVPLEKYLAKSPNDKAVAHILFQINQNLGNSEKAMHYKKISE